MPPRKSADVRSRRQRFTRWLVGLLWLTSLLCLLIGYGAVYIALGRDSHEPTAEVHRHFTNVGKFVQLFKPAAWLEAKVRQKPVCISVFIDDGRYRRIGPRKVYTANP